MLWCLFSSAVSQFSHCTKIIMHQWDVFEQHQSQNAICISERLSPDPIFFSSRIGDERIIKFLHFATHMSFLLLSLFLFRKNVETNCSVVPITFPGMRLSQILSRARHKGRVCGYKYKINYRLNRQPMNRSLEIICKCMICHSAFKCNFLVLFAMPTNV